ncbi:MAG: ABC transporter ATP-binding protein [Alphaproteobacteria bacterium]|nr:ABC transporter ATP-binding protein [Alphaproteobacteria bacterium]
MAPDDVLLHLEDVVVRFAPGGFFARGHSFSAVDGVSLTVRRGEVFGLVGESGSGKTTVAKALLRLHEPAAGRILFEGTDITHLPERRLKPMRRRMQMVFQDPLASLNPRHRIGDALAAPLKLHRLCAPGDIARTVDRMLSRVGLSPAFKQRFPHELSGGQLQRAAIGRALLLSPSLLVADEAVSKLDASVRAQILNLFKDLQEELKLAILFITHDLHVARYLCHRVGVMYFGKLVEVGPAAAMFAAPRHPYTQALLGTIGEDAALAGAPTLPPDAFRSPHAAPGCRYYDRCPIRQPRCDQAPPVLGVAATASDGDRAVACWEAPARPA